MTTLLETAPDPVSHTHPLNARILAISEDKIAGFHPRPFAEIARLAALDETVVLDRIRAMLEAGVIRRVRQTLLATNLAQGALCAWKIAPERLDAAFDFMFRHDPFSGHVVLRSTDRDTPGSQYRLWTTIKVPAGEGTLEEHAELLRTATGAEHFRLMPAKGIFALGVGHVRRKTLQPGDKSEHPAAMTPVHVVHLQPHEWTVLLALKRELTPEEIVSDPWTARAAEAGVPLADFIAIARSLQERKLIGRFSTFLEHVKPTATGERVTRFNALFHWAVPPGLEQRAGAEAGRHHCLTHCYWREAGEEFNNVNIMAVAHGTEKENVLAHKQAIDDHLRSVGIPFAYTNVFWGGRSEIKPSEISPLAHRQWRESLDKLKLQA